jgi:hypothetical protein
MCAAILRVFIPRASRLYLVRRRFFGRDTRHSVDPLVIGVQVCF